MALQTFLYIPVSRSPRRIGSTYALAACPEAALARPRTWQSLAMPSECAHLLKKEGTNATVVVCLPSSWEPNTDSFASVDALGFDPLVSPPSNR